jgi:S1-C subfamily serine protease
MKITTRRLCSLVVTLTATAALTACHDPMTRVSPAASAASPPAVSASVSSAPTTGTRSIPDVVAAVDPSVVTVVVEDRGLGSGVVYKSGGIIVTNEHVVGDAQQVEVELADGTRTPAKVLATDRQTDLAVLQADRKDLPPLKFQTTVPRIGETVLAIGSPLGFQNSVTEGILSGLGREIPGSATQGGEALVDLMQTDAAISPGNSGGALLNTAGEVIGLNEAYIPPSLGAVNIGFAIPAVTVTKVVDQLLTTGHAQHPYLGIAAGTLTPQVADALGLGVDRGVVISDVTQGGPAAAAGIQRGDVMVRFNGHPVDTFEALLGELRQVQPGDKVQVELQRAGKRVTVSLTVGTQPQQSD